MLSSILPFAIAVGAACALAWFLFGILKSSREGVISGKLIWTDHGRKTKAFRNTRYRVYGKPDLMYRIPAGVKAVEYKHRKGPVHQSDMVQALAASLAARGEGYKVVEILLKTRTEEVSIDLRSSSDEAIYRKISGLSETVRRARSGAPMNSRPESRKCRNCAYREACA
ncbi:hypothetical protein DOK_11896 [gamma proteobacterium BDW918]|nr:hypothetical protein DOK_11896 [gamma proteobacterium BDW918]